MKIMVSNKSPNDYPSARVVRLEYLVEGGFMTPFKMHMSVINYIRKHILGTWGYSRSLQRSEGKCTVYLFFQDDNDYLVFKLWCKYNVITTSIWPFGLTFTVMEEVPDDLQFPD